MMMILSVKSEYVNVTHCLGSVFGCRRMSKVFVLKSSVVFLNPIYDDFPVVILFLFKVVCKAKPY